MLFKSKQILNDSLCMFALQKEPAPLQWKYLVIKACTWSASSTFQLFEVVVCLWPSVREWVPMWPCPSDKSDVWGNDIVTNTENSQFSPKSRKMISFFLPNLKFLMEYKTLRNETFNSHSKMGVGVNFYIYCICLLWNDANLFSRLFLCWFVPISKVPIFQ